MLYKKYHRNYVSRFKIGVSVELIKRSIGINSNLIITTGPTIELNLVTGRFYITLRFAEDEVLPLVFSSGRLMYYNVIQEIS